MSTAIEKRIAKLEGDLLPKKLPKLRLLYRPLRDADADSWAAHEADLEDARSKGEMAIVVCAKYASDRKPLPGVRFVNSELEGHVEILASQPSERGNKSRWDDVFEDLPGNVLGVSKNTVDEVPRADE